MNIRLHKNATTTPARRFHIQSLPLSVAKLAAKLGVLEDMVFGRYGGGAQVHSRRHVALGVSRAKEGLHDRRERTERKAHGAQRPRHNNELGEGAKTKFRRRLTSAQPM